MSGTDPGLPDAVQRVVAVLVNGYLDAEDVARAAREGVPDLTRRLAEAEAKVARVEALVEEWQADWPGPGAAWNGTPDEWWHALRDALADPPPAASS